MRKLSKQGSDPRIKSPLLCQLSYGPKPPQPLASTHTHLHSSAGDHSETHSVSGVIGGEPTTSKGTLNPFSAPRDQRTLTPLVWGLPARDWADVGRAFALGCLLALVVVFGCPGAAHAGRVSVPIQWEEVGVCLPAPFPWGLAGGVVLAAVSLAAMAAAAGTSHGERLARRRLLRELEEEGKAIPSLWKGARR